MAEARTKRMDLAFAALLSKDEEEILAAITRIGQEGDARAIRPLLAALASSTSTVVHQGILALLYQVKTPGADKVLLAALGDPELLAVRSTILSTFWNAGIDVRDHLKTFIDIALEGSAAECFECLTIVENQEIWPEQATRAALRRVVEATPDVSDAYKATILHDLAGVLRHRLGVDV